MSHHVPTFHNKSIMVLNGAHGKSRAPEGTYLGHPDFEGFEVVIS